MTEGLEVLVQDVMAAITTAPSLSPSPCPLEPLPSVPGARGRSASELSSSAGGSLAGKVSSTDSSCGPSSPSSSRRLDAASESGTRSCGRRGPASEGTTSPRSSSNVSE